MKKTLLKFSKSLLSTEETKTIKGGYDIPGGGGGGGGFHYIICGAYNQYPPEVWIGQAGFCPSVEYGTAVCQSQYPPMYYISKTC